jgi:hypothetical protein
MGHPATAEIAASAQDLGRYLTCPESHVCLDTMREFPENIPYKIISLLKGQIKVKPAPDQCTDDFSDFTFLNHDVLFKQFLYQRKKLLCRREESRRGHFSANAH